jgi:hypothetical protein
MMSEADDHHFVEEFDNEFNLCHNDDKKSRCKEYFRGNFWGVDPDFSVQKWALYVFVSSTFTDTKEERNLLLESIVPQLQQKYRKDRIDIVIADMRFGVRDTMTLNHHTWIACKKALELCYQKSGGLFFLSLQGGKYGYRPLPLHMNKSVVDAARAVSETVVCRTIYAWYTLDENSIDPMYTLRPLDCLSDGDYWEHALPVLRETFTNVAFANSQVKSDSTTDARDTLSGSAYDLLVGRSVTEWEALWALERAPERCHWLARTFQPISTCDTAHNALKDSSGEKIDIQLADDPQMLFRDTYDSESMGHWKRLRRQLETSLGPLDNITRYDSHLTLKAYITREDDLRQYLTTWGADTLRLLTQEADGVLERKRVWETGDAYGLPGALLTEFVHHIQLCKQRVASCQPNVELLNKALGLVLLPNRNIRHLDNPESESGEQNKGSGDSDNEAR